MDLTRHKNTLYRNLGEDAVKILKASNAIIAGGAITSIFSNSDINDFDIYFRNKKDLLTFVYNAFGEEDLLEEKDYIDVGSYAFICTNTTTRSISFSHDNKIMQLIYFNYFDDASEIFKSYDFEMNMGAFDFKTESFELHKNFVTSLAERRLTFNTGTAYPIMSSLRVSKYVERGYSISRKEMFKIGLAISELNINSWNELEDQLSGFYGIDVSEMFDRSIPFDMDTAINMIDKVHELPTLSRQNPSLKKVLFCINGNPYKDQRVFFATLNVETRNDETVYVNGYDGDTFTVGEITNISTPIAVETSIETVREYYNDRYVTAILVLEPNAKMDMGYSKLEIKGPVKLLAVQKMKSR